MKTLIISILISLLCVQTAAAKKHENTVEEKIPFSVFVTAKKLKIEKPGGLAFDGKLVWVADRINLRLVGFDPVNGKAKKTLTSPGTWPTGLAFDGELLWVADKTRGIIFGIDTKSKLVVKEIEGPSNPLGLAFDGEHLWVADGRRLHRVTREDGTTIVSFNAPPWGKGRSMDQQGLAYLDGYLWVSDRKTDKIYKVEPRHGDVVDILPAPGPFPTGLTFVDNKLLIANVHKEQIDQLSISAIPRVVRSNPKNESVILRRRVTNNGPDTLKDVDIYIAIPKSRPNQALSKTPVFTPSPADFVTDKWGQKFAHFKTKDLEQGKSLDVSMKVYATLFAVRYHIDPNIVGSLKSIPAKIRRQYLVDGSKFQIKHPSIKKHLKAALNGEKRPYWMIRKIARYIGDNMRYELTGGWNIAPTVIDRGTGSCSEYTFVFIAMCRAAGIPARYAGAMVVRGDDASTDEVFHRWAEVYLPGYGWIPADAQAADQDTTAKQSAGLGSLVNRFVITTVGGGDSKYIAWSYNSDATWTCKGRCLVKNMHIGDWYPTEKETP